MSILRIERQQPGAYVPRDTAHDTRLSPEALGLLAWLLAHGDSWEVRVPAIVREMQQRNGARRRGRDYTQRLLRELEDAGYLHREQRRTDGGHWAWISTIHDVTTTTTGSTMDGSAGHGSAVDGASGHIRTIDQTNNRLDEQSSSIDDDDSRCAGDDVAPQLDAAVVDRVAARWAAGAVAAHRLTGYVRTSLRGAGLAEDDATIQRYVVAVRARSAETATTPPPQRRKHRYPPELLAAAAEVGIEPAGLNPAALATQIVAAGVTIPDPRKNDA